MNEQLIFSIIEKFNNSDITEIDIDDGTTHLLLRKEHAPVFSGKTNPLPVSSEEKTPNTSPVTGTEKIVSPIVGTFYLSPSPDAPPFVKPGSVIKTGQTLCILEAMKMMNHFVAEFDCEIVEILVNNGELVEYGQNLFVVKKH